jgi:ribosomal protein S18 acetylase RimI-like enzyme
VWPRAATRAAVGWLALVPVMAAAAAAAVAAAAAQEGLPERAEALFEPPLLLLPFRSSELPPEIKQATDALVESNMRAVYDASGWSEENEAPEGANGEVLYLLLFQQSQDDGDGGGNEEEEEDPMAALISGMLGFVAAEFSVESGKPALYIVELQLAPKARRRGLGAKLTATAVRTLPNS